MKLSNFKTVFILVSFVFDLTSCSDDNDDSSLDSVNTISFQNSENNGVGTYKTVMPYQVLIQ